MQEPFCAAVAMMWDTLFHGTGEGGGGGGRGRGRAVVVTSWIDLDLMVYDRKNTSCSFMRTIDDLHKSLRHLEKSQAQVSAATRRNKTHISSNCGTKDADFDSIAQYSKGKHIQTSTKTKHQIT